MRPEAELPHPEDDSKGSRRGDCREKKVPTINKKTFGGSIEKTTKASLEPDTMVKQESTVSIKYVLEEERGEVISRPTPMKGDGMLVEHKATLESRVYLPIVGGGKLIDGKKKNIEKNRLKKEGYVVARRGLLWEVSREDTRIGKKPPKGSIRL